MGSKTRVGFPASVLLAWAGLFVSCGGTARPPPVGRFDPAAVDGDRAYAEVADLVALGPRDAGTPGGERAALHLRGRLEALGIEAHIDAFEDPTPIGPLVFRNVVGRLPGRGRGRIILGSHFDTKRGMGPDFEGANDSGSSTGLLLELARVMAEGPEADPEIWFAFFDGEESIERYGPRDGLHGSRRMARALVADGRASGVRAVIVLDMVGDRDLTITLPHNATPWLLARVLDAASAEGVRERFRLLPHAIIDDHEPFLDAGMPAVNLIDFEYGSAPGLNDYWHTDEDRMDKIRAESLGIVGRVTLRLVNTLLGDPAPE